MQRIRMLIIVPWLALSVPGCDALQGGDEKAAGGEDGKDGKDGKGADEDQGNEGGGEAVAASTKTFDKGLKKRGCELLTADMVGQALDVPAGDLEQMKVLGCSYSWEGDGEVVEAAIRFIRVHDDAEQAQRWFRNMTKDQSAEEIKAAMDEVKKRVEDKGEIKGATQEKAVDAIGSALTDSMAEGVSFEEVPGIGDAAAASNENGKLYILLGNVTFDIEAYKGKPHVPPPMNPSDMKGSIKVLQKAAAKWAKETAPQHKEASIAVAKLVLAKM